MEAGRFNYILNACENKKVLHIGCADEGLTKKRFDSGQLLHERIYEVSKECWGIDNSSDGLLLLRDLGFENLIEHDIEKKFNIGEFFDIVVVSEVLEHLSNPGLALNNIRNIKSDKYIFSVPSARFRFSEHPDHNFYFTEKSIKTLLFKHGFKIEDLRGYHFCRLQPWPDGYLVTAI